MLIQVCVEIIKFFYTYLNKDGKLFGEKPNTDYNFF